MSEEKSAFQELLENDTQEAQTNQASQVNAGQVNTETPPQENATTTTSTSSPAETTQEAKPTVENTETERTLESFLAESKPAEVQTDYKSLFEKQQSELARFKNPLIESLVDALESPNFNVEEFFESYKPKELKNMELQDLWIMNKKATSTVDWTAEELEEAYNEEMAILGESSFRKKALKDELVKSLQGKIDLGKEPEYVTLIRNEVKNRREQAEQAELYREQMNNELLETFDSMEGIKIVGDLAITKEHIEAAKKTMQPEMYLNEDGTINKKMLSMNKMIPILFNDLLAEYRKVVSMETKIAVHRPNPNSTAPIVNEAKVVDAEFEQIKGFFKNPELANELHK